MIYLFTDFGWSGPYVGEMKAVLTRELPNVGLIDLMHDAPVFNPKTSAYLLAALSTQFKPGDICLAVVDPGVGDSQRRAIIVEADGVRFVGPDNGLFAVTAHRAKKVSCLEILWQPEKLSASFHGRDLFAPAASRLFKEDVIESERIPVESLVGHDYPEQFAEVIYIDHFGNAVTGLIAAQVPATRVLTVAGHQLRHARTFSDVSHGEIFWYENSMGLVEIAANGASASGLMDLAIGAKLVLREPE